MEESKLLEDFFGKYTKLHYKRGEILIRAGEPPPGVFYLKKGVVKQYLHSEIGETLILHTYRQGAFFPMIWALNDIPNAYYFEALTQVEILRAPREEVINFLKKQPEILFHFTSRILNGLQGLLKRIEYLVIDSAYIKTVKLLVSFAKLYGEKTREGVEIKIPSTHKEIGAWIGTARETASIQMEELYKKGLILRNKHIIIPSLEKLEKELKRNSSS